MEVLRSDELRAADINSIFWGVSTQLLMENAGAGVARVVREMTGGVAGRVAVVAGVGGKAGDSFVMARHLAGDGYEVQVFLVSRLAGSGLAGLKAHQARGRQVELGDP
ncbi:MAG: NAD(P)H-hydrate epimerase [Zestosphaera sp.]